MNNKNKQWILRWGWILSTILPLHTVHAAAPGSEAVYGGPLSTLSIAAGGLHISTEETLYIGPGRYEIDGSWKVYSKFVIIDPAAIITGTGSIELLDPAAAGAAAGRTFIDGNAGSVAIEVNLILNNAQGMELFDHSFPADLLNAGFVNDISSTLYIGKDLDLAVDGADIWLDADATGDLRFDNNASISNYSADRMVITNNSVISHVVRDAGSSGFFFPLGIADGDYTPAELSGPGEYHVSVQNYAASASAEGAPPKGMDRTWHIFGDPAASVTLHHNSPATDGTGYSDAVAFITRYQGSLGWTTFDSPEQVTTGVHTNAGAIGIGIPADGLAAASYLTKTSDPSAPLPVSWMAFEATKEGRTAHLNWQTANETNNKGFEVERSKDAKNWSSIGFVFSKASGGSSNAQIGYDHIDAAPVAGTNCYRLKQVSSDGSYEYSPVRILTFERDGILVYPNPAVHTVMIEGLHAGEKIQLLNATGRQVVAELTAGSTTIAVDISAQAAGVYYLQVFDKDLLLTTRKIIKQ